MSFTQEFRKLVSAARSACCELLPFVPLVTSAYVESLSDLLALFLVVEGFSSSFFVLILGLEFLSHWYC